MNCSKCGQDLPAEAKFCFGCGTKMQLQCPSCQADLPAGAKFCLACGKAVGEEPSAAQAVTSVLGYCKGSGAAIHAKDSHFKCFKCGQLFTEEYRFEKQPICSFCAYEEGTAQQLVKERAEQLRKKKFTLEITQEGFLKRKKSSQDLIDAICEAGVGSLNKGRNALESGAEVNKPSNDGSTPLLLAVNYKIYDLAALLIEYGADVDQVCFVGKENEQKKTNPLLHAIRHYQDDFVALLAENGANCNIVVGGYSPFSANLLGFSALGLVCKFKNVRKEIFYSIFDTLFQYGFNPHGKKAIENFTSLCGKDFDPRRFDLLSEMAFYFVDKGVNFDDGRCYPTTFFSKDRKKNIKKMLNSQRK